MSQRYILFESRQVCSIHNQRSTRSIENNSIKRKKKQINSLQVLSYLQTPTRNIISFGLSSKGTVSLSSIGILYNGLIETLKKNLKLFCSFGNLFLYNFILPLKKLLYKLHVSSRHTIKHPLRLYILFISIF